jgi:hypothetical protein
MPINRTPIDHLVNQLIQAAEADHPNGIIEEMVVVVSVSEGDVSEIRVRYGGPDPSRAVNLLNAAAATRGAQGA